MEISEIAYTALWCAVILAVIVAGFMSEHYQQRGNTIAAWGVVLLAFVLTAGALRLTFGGW